jgi:hypothetical protein
MHQAGIRARECQGDLEVALEAGCAFPCLSTQWLVVQPSSSLTVAGAAPELQGDSESSRQLTGFPLNPPPFNVGGRHLVQAPRS